jgi:hypothetical protein
MALAGRKNSNTTSKETTPIGYDAPWFCGFTVEHHTAFQGFNTRQAIGDMLGQ